MSRQEIIATLRDLLRQQQEIKVDVDSINEQTNIDQIGFDSLSILDFMYEVENSFKITMQVPDLVDLEKVSDLIDFLERKLGE